MKKRLQNKIAESRFALPVTVLYSLLIWFTTDFTAGFHWFQFVCVFIATYLMVMLNKNNALIRIFTNMVSCSFLMLVIMSNELLANYKTGILAIFVISFLIFLFRAYQERNATGLIFYSFVCIGIASMAWINILIFVPIIWILMGNNIQCLSVRTFFSSLLGIMAPYWIAVGYYIYSNRLSLLVNHLKEIVYIFPTFNYSNITNHEVLSVAMITLLFIIGTVHFFRHSFYDKIRVRLIFEFFITINIFTLIFMVLLPQHISYLTMILIINTAPLIGHFFALTRTKWTNISFFLLSSAVVFITLYNIWTSSIHF